MILIIIINILLYISNVYSNSNSNSNSSYIDKPPKYNGFGILFLVCFMGFPLIIIMLIIIYAECIKPFVMKLMIYFNIIERKYYNNRNTEFNEIIFKDTYIINDTTNITDNCTICISELNNDNNDINDINDNEVVKMECNHCFHYDCIIPWLEMNIGNYTCPVCRESIYKI